MRVETRTKVTAVKQNTSRWSERRFVAVVIGAILLLTSLPYIYAFWSAPPDKQFMGIMLDVPDHGQYFSWMRELATAPLAANKLTPEANRPVFFNLLWWGMGRLGRLLGLGFTGVYQLLRLGSGALFLLLVYQVISWFVADLLQRRIAFLVTALTSGFGWVLIALKYTFTAGELLFPLDVYIAEGNTFLGILGYPHFIAAGLYIYVFDILWRGRYRNSLWNAVWAGFVALFLGWQHAYDLILVYGIIGVIILFVWLRDKRLQPYWIKSLLIIGFLSWWPALYSVILTEADPLWAQVLAQYSNAGVYTPNLMHLPVLLGPAFLLALYTILREKPWRMQWVTDRDLYLRAWFIANFLLIYIPTDYQIHMLNGWQVPIAILATQGVFRYLVPPVQRWLDRLRSNPTWPFTGWLKRLSAPHLLGWALVFVVLPTNLYLFSWRFIELARHTYPYYLYKDEVAAMQWLDAHASPDDVVLSSLITGQYIPAMSGTYAFLAHWAQTLDFFNKRSLVNAFYDAKTLDAQRMEMLADYSVDYVFYGPAEDALGNFNPEKASYLEPVFSSPLTRVYAVIGVLNP